MNSEILTKLVASLKRSFTPRVKNAAFCNANEARELFEKSSNYAAGRLNARLLLGLWMSGFLKSLNYVRVNGPGFLGLSRVKNYSPLEEAQRCLDELDNMAAADRNDLSALKDRKQAIIARQTINEANGSREVFDVAFRLYN